MTLLIFSGLLYLCGISVVLILKPELMFSKDGNWKEFGLGRNKYKYTWMPFWLFAIIWAIVSYIIVLVIATAVGYIGNKIDIAVPTESIERENVSKKSMDIKSNTKSDPNTMKPGYYILDKIETEKKYIILNN